MNKNPTKLRVQCTPSFCALPDLVADCVYFEAPGSHKWLPQLSTKLQRHLKIAPNSPLPHMKWNWPLAIEANQVPRTLIFFNMFLLLFTTAKFNVI